MSGNKPNATINIHTVPFKRNNGDQQNFPYVYCELSYMHGKAPLAVQAVPLKNTFLPLPPLEHNTHKQCDSIYGFIIHTILKVFSSIHHCAEMIFKKEFI